MAATDGLDHDPGHCADGEAAGPHSGPYGPAPVGSAVRTSEVPSGRLIGIMITAYPGNSSRTRPGGQRHETQRRYSGTQKR